MTGVPLASTDPQAIGDYRLVGRLGAGGMGTVYLAEDAAGGSVAVKVLHEHLAGDPQFLARFAAEAAAARRVAGFCTARLIHAEVRGPRPFLVTEYVDGPTLQQVLADSGRLTGSQVEALAVGVAAALTAIHAVGVVHRDLKPSNVMLSGFGPKVIDFGVAKALDAAGIGAGTRAAVAGATMTGMVFGTLGWMAPEQWHGVVSPAGDVYVWGLLVANAGTGWRPEQRPAGPASAPPAAPLAELPAGLARLVGAALQQDPARRPSARELLLRLCGSAEPGPVRTATAVLSRPWDPRYTGTAHAPPPGSAHPAPWPVPPPAGSNRAAAGRAGAGRAGAGRAGSNRAGSGRGESGRPAPMPPAPMPAVPMPAVPMPVVLMPPPRVRKKRWYRRKRVLIPGVLIGLLVAFNAGDQPGTDLPPHTARDGILEFGVTAVQCGQQALGPPGLQRRAQGQLCTVEVHVSNFGGQTRRVHVGSQKLYDKDGRAFDADGGAWLYLPASVPFFQQEINPGNAVTATLVYDIAAGAVPARLEVHDSPLSNGASITL